MGSVEEPTYLYQNITKTHPLPTATAADGIYFTLENGQKILDATSRAAVSAICHGNKRVRNAIVRQLDTVAYCHPGYFQNTAALELADWLVKSTGSQLSRACILGSGSEAVEAVVKLAYQYFAELTPESPRVSPCHPWHNIREEETVEDYVACLKEKLEDEFQRLSPDTVCTFILEPMVGTALGCVTAVLGYLCAVKQVCDRHRALLIFDEIIYSLGRTGAQHAWQHDDVVPDIQTVGKVLGGGYAPISAMLVHNRVLYALKAGSRSFAHRHTYQAQPLACITALETQHYIQENNLIENVRCMGDFLREQLKLHLGQHPILGDIRGRGLFWAIKLVKDKATKAPLDPRLKITKQIQARGLERGYDICIFTATGATNSWNGDQFLLAPPFTVQKHEMEEIMRRVVKVVDSV